MMKRRIEIRYDEFYERFELWEVFYNPKDILYPIQWSNFWDFNKNREVLIYIAKKQFPDLWNEYL